MVQGNVPARRSLLGLLLLAQAGCWGSYVGYLPVQESALWVPPRTLAEIETRGLPRDEVIATLGPADATAADGSAIGYLRCTEPSGGINYPGGDRVNDPHAHCQMIGVWFDDAGRAMRVKSAEGMDDYYTGGCAVDRAIKRSWGSCWW